MVKRKPGIQNGKTKHEVSEASRRTTTEVLETSQMSAILEGQISLGHTIFETHF
jgi:hypothetical protein